MNFNLKLLGYNIVRAKRDVEHYSQSSYMKDYANFQNENLKKYQAKFLNEACKELIKINKNKDVDIDINR